MSADVDSQGRCVRHPYVQLQRRSHRTGEWKALLDNCPLCSADNTSVASSVVEGGAPAPSPASAPGAVRGRSRSVKGSFEEQLESLTPRGVTRSRSTSTSRVWFNDGDSEDAGKAGRERPPLSGSLTGLSSNGGIITVNGGICSSSQLVVSGSSQDSQQAKSVLKAPRYKACKEKMRIQASQIEEVATMSMHLSMDRMDSDSDGEEEESEEEEEAATYFCQPCQATGFCQPCNENKSRIERKLEKMALPQDYAAQGDLSQDNESQEATAASEVVSDEEQSRATGSSGVTSQTCSSGVTERRRNRSLTRHQKPSVRTSSCRKSNRRRNSIERGGRPDKQEKKRSSSLQVASQRRPDSEVTGSNVPGSLTRHQKPILRASSCGSINHDSSSNSSSKQSKRRHCSFERGGRPDKQEKKRSSSLQVASQRRPDSEAMGSNVAGSSLTGHQKPILRTSSCGSISHDSSSKISKRRRNSLERGGCPDKQEKKRSSSLQVASQRHPDREATGSNVASPDGDGPKAPRLQRRQDRSSSRQRRQANGVASSFSSANPDQEIPDHPGKARPPPPPSHPNLMINDTNNLSLQVLFDEEESIFGFMGINPDLSGKACAPTPPPPPPHPDLKRNDINNHSLRVLFDDEVSTLNFMDNSVHTQDNQILPKPNNRGSCSDEGQDDKEEGQDPLMAGGVIDMDDFDEGGRCRHHPHVKLRKKKLFGKGWMVCPHCVVDKIRKIKMVEEDTNKRVTQKLDRNERGGGDPSRVRQNAASGPRSLAGDESQHQPKYKPPPSSRPPPQQKQGASSRFKGSNENRPSPISPKIPVDYKSRAERSAAGGTRSLASNGIQRPPQHQSQPPPPPLCPTPQKLRSSLSGTGRNEDPSGGHGSTESTKMPAAVPPPPPRTTRTQKRPPAHDERAKGPPPRDGRRPPPVPPARQDSFRDTPVPLAKVRRARSRGSPSRDGFRGNGPGAADAPAPGKDARRGPSDDDAATASLTSDEQIDDDGRTGPVRMAPNPGQVDPSLSPEHQKAATAVREGKIKKSNGKLKDPRQEVPPSPSQPQRRGTILVQQMRWTDAEGLSGSYTGHVNVLFFPCDRGTMEYDGGAVKEGEWKNGRCHNDKGNRNVSKDSNNSGSGIIRSGMGRLLRSKPREGRRSRSRAARGGQRSSSRGRPKQPIQAAE